MEEKIYKLREELINKLKQIEDGIHIKLNYDARILEAIIFTTGDNEIIVDEYGNRKQSAKYFALPKEILTKIDFSNIDFTNFNAIGYNFTGLYNVKLDPQSIWDKDLMGAKLNGVEFIGFFDDVRLNEFDSGYVTDFTGSKGATIDISKVHRLYYEYICLNDCIFNGVTFTYPFKSSDYTNTHRYKIEFDIRRCNFTGSIGAIIYPDFITYLGLINCTLCDAILASKITGDIYINGCDFTGAKQKGNMLKKYKQIEFLPHIKNDYTNTNFNGVHFLQPLQEGCLLNNTSFKGSTGAIIDLRIINPKSNLDNCNFSDSKVIGDDGKKMIITEDGKLSHDFLYELDNFFGIEHTKDLITKEELEKERQKLIQKKRKEIFHKINEVVKLTKSLETLGIEPNHLYGTIPITKELLLVKVNDHLEINRDIIDASLIRFFNLSLINFNNVKVSGIDFRKSKAKIDPQIVYNKDISNCTFDDFNISPFTNFDNVIMDNTDFSECSFEINIKKKSI